MEEKPPIRKTPMEVIGQTKKPDDPKVIRARIYAQHYETYFPKGLVPTMG